MSPSTDIRKKAIILVEQLPQRKLPAIVQLLELLAEPSGENIVNEEESKLIDTIQQQLPKDEQLRLNDLRDRRERDELNEAEYQQLISYEDRLEAYRAERLAALINLAKLRDIDLVRLNRQLQATSQSSNAA